MITLPLISQEHISDMYQSNMHQSTQYSYYCIILIWVTTFPISVRGPVVRNPLPKNVAKILVQLDVQTNHPKHKHKSLTMTSPKIHISKRSKATSTGLPKQKRVGSNYTCRSTSELKRHLANTFRGSIVNPTDQSNILIRHLNPH